MKQSFYVKVLIIIFSAMIFVSLTGCRHKITGGTNGVLTNDVTIDVSKTQIYVGNYYGGLGDLWLEKVKNEFEEMYKDLEIEDKKGVEIIIDNRKEQFSGESLINNISSSYNEIFFTEKVNLPQYISQNLLYDISDVVKEYNLGEFYSSENNTYIKDKLNSVDDFLKKDEKYYALPFYEGYYSIIYDVDLFEEKGYYFIKNYKEQSELVDKFIQEDEDEKSMGPDGEYGTYDDGLPATYSDFIDLCNYISLDKGTAAIVYPGSYPHYWVRFMFNLWANNEGKEQLNLNFTLDGSANTLINISGGNITKLDPVTILPDGSNAAMLQKQIGKYYVLKFINDLAKNRNYFSSKSGSYTHTDAENEFIWGRFDPDITTPAMLIDGNWFESEATGAFETATNSYGIEASKANRRIAVLPLPKATDELVGTPSTFFGTNNSFCFINANVSSKKIDIVKKFFAFCHTDKSLGTFTQHTSMARPFNYEIEDMSKLSYYAKSVYTIHKNSDFVYPYSMNSYVNSNSTKFAMDEWSFTSIVSGNPYANPFVAFSNYKNLTVEDYFNGMYQKQS